MKMRTLAAAVGLAASLPMTATAAQDFYGNFHLSVDRAADYPTANLINNIGPDAGLADAWAVESNNSRLGLRGDESLNRAGMSVIYQLEVAADIDGDEGNTFTTRNSFLGVDTNVGRIFAGRYDSSVKQIEGGVDQINHTAADMDNVTVGQQRLSNTLNWHSVDYNGLKFGAQVAPGEGELGEDGLADTLGLSAQWEQDGLYVAGAFTSSFIESEYEDPLSPPDTITAASDLDILRLVARMDLGGGVQVGGLFEQAKVDSAEPGADSADGTTLLVSGRVQANERLAFKGQLGRFDSSDLDTEVMTITLGGDYRLGKQTVAYGLLSISDAEAGGADESGNLLSVGLSHCF